MLFLGTYEARKTDTIYPFLIKWLHSFNIIVCSAQLLAPPECNFNIIQMIFF